MRRSTDRILASHAGVLPVPEDLLESRIGLPGTRDEFETKLPAAVQEVVQLQIDRGIDIVNDGELAKIGGFSGYLRSRLRGFAQRPFREGERPERAPVDGRDRRRFPRLYSSPARRPGPNVNVVGDPFFAVEPLVYEGQDAVARDIANLKAACAGRDVEPYLPGVAPGTIEHWLYNDYYKTEEEYLFALADVLHEEFKAITDAGIILQVDDPDLPDGWQMYPAWSVEEYRKYAQLRVEALNHAIRGLPEELVRFHICWGSQHGPHADDIPLAAFIDLVFKVRAECYSIEASNPQHEHEWRVFEDVKLPDGKSLMPGVVGHTTDVIEHPQTVADRIVRYANLVGRENVLAGTDCGLSNRVGGPEICWAKLEVLGRGAALASKALWGSA